MMVIYSNATVPKNASAILAVSVLLICTAPNPASGDYILQWSTIDGGGRTAASERYVLSGTIGQPDTAYSEGGHYELLAGFWTGPPVCIVNFKDFARFADYWRESGSSLPADLYPDNYIDSLDLDRFVEEWLYACPYNWPLR
jgi:hypothetical protein